MLLGTFPFKRGPRKIDKREKKNKIAEGSHPKQRESEINNIGNTEHSSNLIQLL